MLHLTHRTKLRLTEQALQQHVCRSHREMCVSATHSNICAGTSDADEAVAVSDAQMQVRQLLQDVGNSSGLQGFTHTLAPPGLTPFPGQLCLIPNRQIAAK